MGEPKKTTAEKSSTTIPILALIISGLALAASFYIGINQISIQVEQTRKMQDNQAEQNRKWEMLNKGYLDLESIDFMVFKEIDQEKFNKENWGYKNGFVQSAERGKMNDKVSLITTLVLWDSVKNAPVKENPFYTVSECKAAMKRNNLSLSTPIYQNYIINVEMKNMGSLPMNNLTFSTTATVNKEAVLDISKSANGSSTGFNLSPNKSASIQSKFYVPLDTELISPIKIEITANYNDGNGNTVKDIFSYEYTDDTGWSRISPSENK
jgi:hypothetical protein